MLLLGVSAPILHTHDTLTERYTIEELMSSCNAYNGTHPRIRPKVIALPSLEEMV